MLNSALTDLRNKMLKRQMVINENFYLREGCRLIKGASKGAIYDLIGKNIYSVDIKLIEILERASKVEKILELARERDITKQEIMSQIETLHRLGLGFFNKKDIYISPFRSEIEIGINPKRLRTLICRIENRCNLRCQHCPSTDLRITNCFCFCSADTRKKMKVSEWEKIISEAYWIGCENIKIIGGEPFLSDAFDRLLLFLKKMRFKNILLYTNGTISPKKWLRILTEINPILMVPIHSSEPEIHDQIAGVNGSYASLIENIKVLKKASIDVRSYIILQKANIGHIRKIINFVREALKIDYYIDNFNFELLDDDINAKNINYLFKMRPRCNEISLENFTARIVGNKCWLNNLAIDINGDVIPCIKAKNFVLGNTRESSVKEIINNNRIDEYWYLNKDKIETCRQCEFRYACDDCRLNAFKYAGRIDSRYPFCSYDPLKGQWNQALPVACNVRREI